VLTPKQKRKKEEQSFLERKLICTKCGSIFRDCEPFNPDGEGEFNHPINRCSNSGKNFTWNFNPKNGKDRAHGIEQFIPKKFRRAKSQGSKQASKY
jgi:hypothetical protein